nr:hypothetical protein [Tanacetum cinerariifolium]
MASVIICLATNQKFNFSKYIFDNMVKHLDGRVKHLMYLRFVQVFLDNQVEGMDRHNAIFVISSHTKMVFANMKMEGKDFSGKVTPLFETMMVQAPEDMGKGLEILTDPHHTPIVTQPSSSPPQKKQKSRRKQRKEIEVSSPSSEIPNEEGVLDLEEAKTAQVKEIASLKKRVKKLEHKRKSRASGLKRLRNDGSTRRVEYSTEASLGNQEDGRMNEEDMFGVNDLDGDEVVVDVSAKIKVAKPKAIKTAATIVTAAGIRPKEKGIVMQEPSETPLPKPIDSSQQPSKTKDKGKAKMIKLEKTLKRKEQIMIDEEMLFNNTMKWIEAFVLMDTELVKGNDKAVEGSKKAEEGSSKRAACKLEQRDAKREDLEVLWSIVKARFKNTKPVDDMDNLLFQTLKIMFEHHVEDNI